MAAKVGPTANQPPAVETKPMGPVAPAPDQAAPIGVREAVPPAPASGFKQGAPALQGKFAYAPSIRATAFASSPGHKIGLNRPSDILGPGSTKTVGDLLGQLEEHEPDMRLLAGAFNVLG